MAVLSNVHSRLRRRGRHFVESKEDMPTDSAPTWRDPVNSVPLYNPRQPVPHHIHVGTKLEIGLVIADLGLKQHRPRGRLYLEQEIPGKGIGCVAAMSLPPGTLVVIEPALFSVKAPYGDDEIDRAYRRAVPEKRKQFNVLSGGRSLCPTKKDRFIANNLEMRETGSESKAVPRQGIFPRLSRFNHSCVPNAHMMWNERIRRATIRTLTRIEKGTEITVNYIFDEFANSRERQAELDDYGFVCTCEACHFSSDHHGGSDWRRDAMALLNRRLSYFNDRARCEEICHPVYLEMVSWLSVLVNMDDLFRPKGDLYLHSAFWHWEQCKKHKGTLKAVTAKRSALRDARKGLLAHYAASGSNSLAAKEAVTYILELKKLETHVIE